uniref:Uncharacterized protein n=1 Tax=Onchocerca volvulus TaxID=6282 RepID=A0A8R1TL39_ONCVO
MMMNIIIALHMFGFQNTFKRLGGQVEMVECLIPVHSKWNFMLESLHFSTNNCPPSIIAECHQPISNTGKCQCFIAREKAM